MIQANRLICNWLTKLCRASFERRPIMLITEIRAVLPGEGVSNVPGSAGAPVPPNNGSLSMAAVRA